ncbi:hypothetical protein ACJJTC_019347 [Scirpophaga incertulas]
MRYKALVSITERLSDAKYDEMDYHVIFPLFCLVLFTQYFETRSNFVGQSSNEIIHLQEIPREFQVTGHNAGKDFKRFVSDIQRMTVGRDVTAVYKVKVELEKERKANKKKRQYKKMRSKNYNIPLKKQNMKLSNFEVLLRKLAEKNGLREQAIDKTSELTTEIISKQMPMKQIQLKYKPVIGVVKTNYTKIVKPVRNRIITLT